VIVYLMKNQETRKLGTRGTQNFFSGMLKEMAGKLQSKVGHLAHSSSAQEKGEERQRQAAQQKRRGAVQRLVDTHIE